MREARTDLVALVALLESRANGVRWSDIVGQLLERGSAHAAWDEVGDQLTLTDAAERDAAFEAAADQVEAWEAAGIGVVTVLDGDYPQRLREVHEAPPLLFYRGKIDPLDQAVSVVGSRRASERGLSMATSISELVTSRGLSVAAGLALGIDTAAHIACMHAGGRTVAVVGTGILRQYPVQNRQLHEEIAGSGLLLSQFWPDAPAQKHTFLMRNATMSGYSLATVVVEAGETSGARAQARIAVSHGRPVILTDLVVDRNEWAKALIGRPGVYVAASIADVALALTEIVAMSQAPAQVVARLAAAV